MKLDWSQISVSLAVSTTAIAEIVTPLLLSTSFIPELGGKALAELPIHLIGHSRGGSVVSEMARIFGQHGIWVDHVTTLDPHPVSLYNDASVYLYWNILFADNYWQTNPDLFCPNGETIFGAYNRYLSNLIADTIVRTVTFTYGIMELLTSIRSLRTLRQILHQLTVRIGGQPMNLRAPMPGFITALFGGETV